MAQGGQLDRDALSQRRRPGADRVSRCRLGPAIGGAIGKGEQMSSASLIVTVLNLPEGQSLHAQAAVAAAATERLQHRFGGKVKVIVQNPDQLPAPTAKEKKNFPLDESSERGIFVVPGEPVFSLLSVLGKPQDVVEQLIDHAQQGVYRPGAWEREWLCQCFGYDWINNLQPGDPYGRPNCDHIFQKPQQQKKKGRNRE